MSATTRAISKKAANQSLDPLLYWQEHLDLKSVPQWIRKSVEISEELGKLLLESQMGWQVAEWILSNKEIQEPGDREQLISARNTLEALVRNLEKQDLAKVTKPQRQKLEALAVKNLAKVQEIAEKYREK